MAQAPQVQRIGRYEVVRKIATGGMAELFLARYSGPGGFEKRCALKRILPQFAADQTFTRMFLTEAKITAQLDHPNIVQIFELGQDDNGQYFIAMEMVNGVNLRQLLTMARERRPAIPPELAAYVATQALEGLSYAHELRHASSGEPLHLVHRDISPQNILVSYDGAVKLVDFGIVKGASISGETQTGMLKGKVAYMSPEQATGERVDGRSDLFSLAVVLFELIAGDRPFAAVNELMMLKAILEEPPRALTDFAPECPEGIERAVLQGLAKYPDERFSDARAFHRELDLVLRECPIPLGRHVVADYVRSLTEGSTVSFDASRLRIPRRAPAGFAHHIGAGPDPHRPWEGPGPVAPLPGPPAEPVPPPAEAPSMPNGSVSMSAPLDGMIASHTDTALRPAELAAAGVPRRPWLPALAIILMVVIWAGVWAWQRADVAAVIVSPDPPPATGSLAPSAPAVAADPPPIPPDTPPPIPVPAPPPIEPTAPTVAVKASLPSPRPARAQPSRPKAPPPPKATKRSATPKPSPAAPPSSTRSPRTANRRGRLALSSTPSGLIVRLGERTLGRTPLEVDLPAGEHRLLLRSPRPGIHRRLTVRIAAKGTTSRSVEIKEAAVQVVSRPWAEVFLDGEARGTTPLRLETYEGRHELKLISSTGEERIQVLRLRGGDNPPLRIRF